MQLRKVCTKCSESFPATIEHFYHHDDCRNGLTPACRKCCNKQRNDWRRRYRDKLAQRRRERYAAENGAKHKAREEARKQRAPYKTTAENLRDGIYARSREHGYDVAEGLKTKSFIEAWLRRQPNCECCGVRFSIGPKAKQGPINTSPSFDRFDDRFGYTLDNTALICWRCNNIKRNYRETDLRMVANWMEGRRRDQIDKFSEAAE